MPLSGAATGRAGREHRRHWTTLAAWRGSAFCRASAGGGPSFLAGLGHSIRRGGNLPPPRRDPAGDRAGGGTRWRARDSRDRGTARRSVSPAYGWPADRAAPPADAAGDARLELRSPFRTGARGDMPPVNIPWRFYLD